MQVNIADGSAVVAALQGLIDRVVTMANVEKVLGAKHDSPVVDHLYWHTERPPLARVAMGCSTNKVTIGVHLSVFIRTYWQTDDPSLPDGLVQRLELQLVRTTKKARCSASAPDMHADLIVPAGLMKAANATVKIVKL